MIKTTYVLVAHVVFSTIITNFDQDFLLLTTLVALIYLIVCFIKLPFSLEGYRKFDKKRIRIYSV